MKFPALIFWKILDHVSLWTALLLIGASGLISPSKLLAGAAALVVVIHSCATYTHALLKRSTW